MKKIISEQKNISLDGKPTVAPNAKSRAKYFREYRKRMESDPTYLKRKRARENKGRIRRYFYKRDVVTRKWNRFPNVKAFVQAKRIDPLGEYKCCIFFSGNKIIDGVKKIEKRINF